MIGTLVFGKTEAQRLKKQFKQIWPKDLIYYRKAKDGYYWLNHEPYEFLGKKEMETKK